MRILIVDDQAMFRQGLRVLLRALRPEACCEERAQPAEAEAALAPDLLLLNLPVQGEDRPAGLRLLRQRFPGALLVALSSLPDAALRRAALAAGADDFLPADMDPAASLEALQRLLDRVAARDSAMIGSAGHGR